MRKGTSLQTSRIFELNQQMPNRQFKRFDSLKGWFDNNLIIENPVHVDRVIPSVERQNKKKIVANLYQLKEPPDRSTV